MIRGKVKWFGNRKGFGFVTTEDGVDIFCHYTGIAAEGYRTLYQNDEVEFDIVEGKKGKQVSGLIVTKSAGPPIEKSNK